MLQNHKLALFSTMLITIFMASSLSIIAQPTWKTTSTLEEDKPNISIYVAEAYYGDLDADGYEDDTFARVELTLSGANRYNFEYWVTLTLPSGQDFVFGWGINTRLNFLNLSTTMYDTALESGWYHLHIEIVLKTGGTSYLDMEHVFDPPGVEHTNTKPSADLTY